MPPAELTVATAARDRRRVVGDLVSLTKPRVVFAPDWEPVIWNEEERGTGVYRGSPLPESFIHYAPPDVTTAVPAPMAAVPVFDPR